MAHFKQVVCYRLDDGVRYSLICALLAAIQVLAAVGQKKGPISNLTLEMESVLF